MKKINIYFAQKIFSQPYKWEVYKNGKPTGMFMWLKTIRTLLDKEQLELFLTGEEAIFKLNEGDVDDSLTIQNAPPMGRLNINFKL